MLVGGLVIDDHFITDCIDDEGSFEGQHGNGDTVKFESVDPVEGGVGDCLFFVFGFG